MTAESKASLARAKVANVMNKHAGCLRNMPENILFDGLVDNGGMTFLPSSVIDNGGISFLPSAIDNGGITFLPSSSGAVSQDGHIVFELDLSALNSSHLSR